MSINPIDTQTMVQRDIENKNKQNVQSINYKKDNMNKNSKNKENFQDSVKDKKTKTTKDVSNSDLDIYI